MGTLGAPSGGAYGFPRDGGIVGRIPGGDPVTLAGGMLAVTTRVGGGVGYVSTVLNSDGRNRSVEVEVTSSKVSGVTDANVAVSEDGEVEEDVDSEN